MATLIKKPYWNSSKVLAKASHGTMIFSVEGTLFTEPNYKLVKNANSTAHSLVCLVQPFFVFLGSVSPEGEVGGMELVFGNGNWGACEAFICPLLPISALPSCNSSFWTAYNVQEYPKHKAKRRRRCILDIIVFVIFAIIS